MAKLPVLSATDVIKVLVKLGFSISRQRGSHIILIRFEESKKRIVVVPNHKEIDPGTLLSIISQSGMAKEEFLDYVK
jgi:predicted RNA binding protein YcfA (HicA-like mRNA interferase family)